MATSFHIRSNSLPSTTHPFTSQFDEHLNKFKSSELTSTSSSSSSIGQNLNVLQDLYDCVDNLLQLSLTRQSLSQQENKKCVQELLDGSLVFLDICSVVKECLLQIKESTLELQSVLRRRQGSESEYDKIKKYFNSKKLVKKAIHKALKNLKLKETCVTDEANETESVVRMLKETEQVTIMAFKSLLSFISGPKSQAKKKGWSIVSKLMRSKRIACDEKHSNELQLVDAALFSSINLKKNNIVEMQNLLKDLEMCIQVLDEGIETLSRRLIKTRVSFLNILSN